MFSVRRSARETHGTPTAFSTSKADSQKRISKPWKRPVAGPIVSGALVT